MFRDSYRRIDADERGKNRISHPVSLDFRQIIVLFLFPVICWAKGVVVSGQFAFALMNSAILKYDLTNRSLIQTIGFFGRPLSIDMGNALYLLTTRGLFKTHPLTGQFTDIFPLYESPQAMFLYKSSLDLVTQNELLIFDIAQKIKVRFTIALEPASRVFAFSAPEGRLFLAKPEGGLEIFEEGKRQVKVLPFPAGVVKIIAVGKLLSGTTGKEVFLYDWTKGKVVRWIPVSEPILDIAHAGNFLVASTERELLLIGIEKGQILKKGPGGGWSQLTVEDNRLFASKNNRVQAFNLPGLDPVKVEQFREPVREFVFEPNTGEIIALGENGLFFEGGGEEQPVVIPDSSLAIRSGSPDSLFALQVGAFGSKTNADNSGKELNRKGLAYYIIEDKGVFKVRVGYFCSKADAALVGSDLKDYKPFIIKDKVIETTRPTTGLDLNHNGNLEWVLNSLDRIVIFSLEGNIYKKVWESPVDTKLKITGIENGIIQVETGEGRRGMIGWSGKQWQLRF